MTTTLYIDYRSWPSGLGQIFNDSKPEMIGDKYNAINIAFEGCGQPNDPSYIETIYFDKNPYETENMEPIFETLRSRGVKYVYDSELGCEDPKRFASGDYNFTLEDWIMTIKGGK